MLPFSLFGALAKFQFLMDKILHLQSAYAIAYLNNIISYSNDHPKFLEMGGSHIKGKEVCSWKGWIKEPGPTLGPCAGSSSNWQDSSNYGLPVTQNQKRGEAVLKGWLANFIDYSDGTNIVTGLTKEGAPDLVQWKFCVGAVAFTWLLFSLCSADWSIRQGFGCCFVPGGGRGGAPSALLTTASQAPMAPLHEGCQCLDNSLVFATSAI